MRHRAVIHEDGSVSLITDTESQQIDIIMNDNPVMSDKVISSEEYNKLQEKIELHKIMYNHRDGKFMFRNRGLVS